MKTERIFLRVSIETKKRLAELASKNKTTMSNYIIDLILNKKLKVQALPDENALKLKNELSIIGKNLWTLIKYNKTLKLTEKIHLEQVTLALKESLKNINKHYDC